MTERVDNVRVEIQKLEALSQERLQSCSLRLGDEDKRIHEAILRLEKEFKERFSRLDELNKERVTRRWVLFTAIFTSIITIVLEQCRTLFFR